MNTLRSRILVVMLSIVIITALSIMYFAQQETGKAVSGAQEENMRNLLQTIVLTVENKYRDILFHKEAVLKMRKAELKNIVSVVEEQIHNHYLRALKGVVSEKTAKKQAIKEISKIRYYNGSGYIWINDIGYPYPKMIMHPTIPELDGQVLDDPEFDCALGENENLFKAFVEVCLAHGDGYVDYLWPKPMKEGLTTKQPKISYVSLFDQWGWIIGSGLYIDDIEREEKLRLQSSLIELRQTISNVQIAESGYVFIFDGNMDVLVHPTAKGQELAEALNPSTGNLILQDLMDASKTSYKPIDYIWDKPGIYKGKYRFPKYAYMYYFEPLDWYIGVSVYHDELDAPVVSVRHKILILTGIFILLSVLLSLRLSRDAVKPLLKLSEAAQAIRHNSDTEIEMPVMGTNETKQLGKILGDMVDSVREKEGKLVESETRFRVIFNNTYQFIGLLSPKGEVIKINRAALASIHCDESEILGKMFWEAPWFSHSVQEQKKIKDAVEWARNGQFVRFEVTTRDFQDAIHYIDFSMQPIKSEDGQISLLIPEGRDITDFKYMEEKIVHAKSFLDTIINSMPSVLIGIDMDDYITMMNQKALELLGVSENSSLGRHLEKIAPEIMEYIRKVRLRQQSNKVQRDNILEYYIDGNKRIFEVITFPLESGFPLVAGEVRGIAVRMDDVTEFRKTDEQLRQAQKMETVGNLAGGLAHDFNNVLVGIYTSVSMLDNVLQRKIPEQSEDVRFYIDTIIDASERAADMIQQLLTLSRKHEIEFAPIDLCRCISSVKRMCENSLPKSVALDFHIPEEKIVISADRTQIEQVLLNLCINASHAMTIMRDEGEKMGGVLCVETEQIIADRSLAIKDRSVKLGSRYVLIRVSDNGVGMDKKIREKIFDPFFSTKDKSLGSGLGMSMVYNIIKQHQGFIRVYSRKGLGTTISIYLPRIFEDINGTEEELQEEILDGNQQMVLVIDDEKIVRNVTQAILRDYNFNVLTAGNGNEGLCIYKEYKDEIKVVILDMSMPDMSGLDTFLELKKIDPNANVILASGFKMDNRVQSALEQGVKSFIQKPFTAKKIALEIKEILG